MKPTIPDTCTAQSRDAFCAGLGVQTTAAKEAFTIMCENLILFDKKHQDYGPRNISVWGIIGVAVRMSDKIERVKNLLGVRRRKPQNESLQDSFRDIGNYSVIAIMVSRGVWPRE